MKLRLLFAAAAASAVAFAAPVRAQEKGFYATLGAGFSSIGDVGYDESYSGTDSLGSFNGTTNYNLNLGTGFAGEAGVGYDFGDVRAEVTYVYGSASLGTATFSGTESGTILGTTYTNSTYSGSFDASGTLSTNSVFVSGYYDIPTKSKFTPYFGGGIGYTNVRIPKTTGTASFTAAGTTTTATVTVPSDSAGAFGYQAKIGLGYGVSETADIFVEGIYQGNTTMSFSGLDFGGLNSFGARAGVRIRFGS